MTDQDITSDLGPIQVGHVYLTRDGEQVTIESVEDSIGVAYYKHKGLVQTCFSCTGTLAEFDEGFAGLGNKYAFRDCDLVKHLGPKGTQMTATRNFTSIKQDQSYRCRDGSIVKVFSVESFYAHYIYKGEERIAWAQDDPALDTVAGQQRLNPHTLEPSDLVELIEDTPENTASEDGQAEGPQAEGDQPDQVSRQALASAINEALARLEHGGKTMDEGGFELNHEGVVEYVILGKPIRWVTHKPVEILFTDPVKSIPNNAVYWILVEDEDEGVWEVCKFINTTPSIGRRHCEIYHVHLSEQAAQNHARILNEFGSK